MSGFRLRPLACRPAMPLPAPLHCLPPTPLRTPHFVPGAPGTVGSGFRLRATAPCWRAPPPPLPVLHVVPGMPGGAELRCQLQHLGGSGESLWVPPAGLLLVTCAAVAACTILQVPLTAPIALATQEDGCMASGAMCRNGSQGDVGACREAQNADCRTTAGARVGHDVKKSPGISVPGAPLCACGRDGPTARARPAAAAPGARPGPAGGPSLGRGCAAGPAQVAWVRPCAGHAGAG